MNDQMQKQLLKLAYEKRNEVFDCSEQEEFNCLIYLIEEGNITSFEELAKYGVEK